eukprot:4758022-Pyramimonas_sp.AAC.1
MLSWRAGLNSTLASFSLSLARCTSYPGLQQTGQPAPHQLQPRRQLRLSAGPAASPEARA